MFSKNKINIYDYTDYRKFLLKFYELEKSLDSTFSYRVFALAVNMDASLLLKVLQCKRHISSKSIEDFVVFLKFKESKAEYFRELVAYSKAKTDSLVKTHFEKIQKMRPVSCRELEEAQYRYFQNWYCPLVRSVLDVFDYHGSEDAHFLGECCVPKLTQSQVIIAVDTLLQLGFVKKIKNRIVPIESHIKTKERWYSACINEYQACIIELAKQSIFNIPKNNRDISTITMALDSNQIGKIKKILEETRKSIINVVNSIPSDECNSVFQLNFQLFPMMNKKEKK